MYETYERPTLNTFKYFYMHLLVMWIQRMIKDWSIYQWDKGCECFRSQCFIFISHTHSYIHSTVYHIHPSTSYIHCTRIYTCFTFALIFYYDFIALHRSYHHSLRHGSYHSVIKSSNSYNEFDHVCSKKLSSHIFSRSPTLFENALNTVENIIKHFFEICNQTERVF